MFYERLEHALNADTAEEKCALTREIFAAFDSDFAHSSFVTDSAPKVLEVPSFAKFCTIVPPQKVPQGKYLKTDLNAAHLLHSLAHIEFCAIDLALDIAYRFRGLEARYYRDWLEVAAQEVEHFCALNHLLGVLGFKYGDFGVHDKLFSAMKNCDILLDRIALIPRGMEAVGLDVNPFLCAKVESCEHKIKDELLSALKVILSDEIEHVSKGNAWFHAICDARQIQQNARAGLYVEILVRHNFSFPKANSQLNTAARLAAGFTQTELEMLKSGAFASKNPK